MEHGQLTELLEKIETAEQLDQELESAVLDGMNSAFPGKAVWTAHQAKILEATDEVLRLVDIVLPNWSISLKGFANEADGRWTCTLRETGVLDNDEMIGIGRAPNLPLAIIAALLKVTILRTD